MAKILYIESKQKNFDFELDKSEIKKLPKTLFLAYSLQYKQLAESIRKQLKNSRIKIAKFLQVLGCSKVKTKYPILLISAGRFHAQNLFLSAPSIYLLEGKTILKITKDEIKRIEAIKRAAITKFLAAEKLGILVSTKPGQEAIGYALNLKQKIDSKGKKAFIFITNEIDINQFENFDIDIWVNTSCPGLGYDSKKIINSFDAIKFL